MSETENKCEKCKKYGKEECLSMKIGRGKVSIDSPKFRIYMEKLCFDPIPEEKRE